MGQITWENLDGVSLDLLVTLAMSYSPPILDGDLRAEGRHTPRLRIPWKAPVNMFTAGAPGGRSRDNLSGWAAAGGRWRSTRRKSSADKSSAGVGVSPMIVAFLFGRPKYTHPPPPLKDG